MTFVVADATHDANLSSSLGKRASHGRLKTVISAVPAPKAIRAINHACCTSLINSHLAWSHLTQVLLLCGAVYCRRLVYGSMWFSGGATACDMVRTALGACSHKQWHKHIAKHVSAENRIECLFRFLSKFLAVPNRRGKARSVGTVWEHTR